MQNLQIYLEGMLDYFAANPTWALAFIFLIAMGEALLVIGLFVPSTAVLVGAGTLVGLGKLEFWPVIIATLVGCIVGDQISYWAGRWYGVKLKALWPLNRYPDMVARGEEFFARHGGKSVAIGRFVPAVKAIVPGIAGMLGMGQLRFLLVNVSSGFVWAFAHVLPGVLIGKGLSVAGELSGRLALLLGLLLIVLLLVGWLIRLAVLTTVPMIINWRFRYSEWASQHPHPWMRALGNVLAPENRQAFPIMVFSVIGITGAVAFALIVERLLAGETLLNSDLSFSNYLMSLRNQPGDNIMVAITMLGDGTVMTVLSLAIIGWLLYRRAWSEAAAAALAIGAAAIFVPFMKSVMQRPRPGDFYSGAEAFSFPSGHATMATVIIGVLAVLLGLAWRPWSKALLYATLSLLVAAIAFSRLYLGAHWPSDVLAGISFALMMTAGFALAVVGSRREIVQPVGLLVTAMIAFLGASALHISDGYRDQVAAYHPRKAAMLMTEAEWSGGSFRMLPERRIDIRGRTLEPMLLQWAGPTEILARALASAGWQAAPPWTWASGIIQLDPATPLEKLPPRPSLHEGESAIATLYKTDPVNAGQRLVLRVWATDYSVSGERGAKPLSLVSLTVESKAEVRYLFAFPHATVPDQGLANRVAGELRGLSPLQPVQVAQLPLLMSDKQ